MLVLREIDFRKHFIWMHACISLEKSLQLFRGTDRACLKISAVGYTASQCRHVRDGISHAPVSTRCMMMCPYKPLCKPVRNSIWVAAPDMGTSTRSAPVQDVWDGDTASFRQAYRQPQQWARQNSRGFIPWHWAQCAFAPPESACTSLSVTGGFI